MPRQIQQFDVVISAPNDLLDDARHVEESLRKINHTLELRGVSIRAKHWSNATVPAKGVEGQEVVRMQLLDNCDILVAIIGKRLGTPTSKHESGTVDEIMTMADKNGILFNNQHVQVYFKNESVNINDINLDELNRVQVFKKKLQDQGFYHGEYQSTSDIAANIVPGITRAIEEYLSRNVNAIILIDKASEKNVDLEIIGPGMLDLIVEFNEKIGNGASRVAECTKILNNLTQSVNNSSTLILPGSNPIENYHITNELAAITAQAAIDINQALKGGEAELVEGMDAVNQLVSIIETESPDSLDSDELTVFINTMQEFVNTTTNVSNSLEETRSSISSGPNISSKLKTATLSLSVSLSNLQNFSKKSNTLAERTIMTVANLIAKRKD